MTSGVEVKGVDLEGTCIFGDIWGTVVIRKSSFWVKKG